jgi:hypothetical protein
MTSVFLASALLRGADFLVYFATQQLRHDISETSDVSTGVFVANSTTGHELRAAEGGAKNGFSLHRPIKMCLSNAFSGSPAEIVASQSAFLSGGVTRALNGPSARRDVVGSWCLLDCD